MYEKVLKGTVATKITIAMHSGLVWPPFNLNGKNVYHACRLQYELYRYDSLLFV